MSKFLGPTGIQTPDLTAFWRSLYQLRLSGTQQRIANCKLEAAKVPEIVPLALPTTSDL